jgi:hypothetical protein|nr:MAG TPA: GIY-YIG nuclease superfamily protein [Caudoviricetes sp.]
MCDIVQFILKNIGKNMFDRNKYYVYLYLDPTKQGNFKYKGIEKVFKFEPFYVGKGCGNRKNFHLYKAKKSSEEIDRNKCSGYCQELLLKGFEPIIIIFEDKLEENVAYDLEKYLIEKIGRKCHNLGSLLNYHFGGELTGHDFHSKDMKKQLSEHHYFNRPEYKPEDHWAYGTHLSIETKQAISKAHKGKVIPKCVKDKISKTLKKSAIRGNEHYTNTQGFSEQHLENLKKSRKQADINRIYELFQDMINLGFTIENNLFNKTKYELVRSRVFSKKYPKWESIPKFLTDEEIKQYFAQNRK